MLAALSATIDGRCSATSCKLRQGAAGRRAPLDRSECQRWSLGDKLPPFPRLGVRTKPQSLPHDFFFFGTLAPFFLAFERPIAIACFLLFTVFRPFPLWSFPLFFLCIARFTSLCAFFPYFAMMSSLKDLEWKLQNNSCEFAECTLCAALA